MGVITSMVWLILGVLHELLTPIVYPQRFTDGWYHRVDDKVQTAVDDITMILRIVFWPAVSAMLLLFSTIYGFIIWVVDPIRKLNYKRYNRKESV